MSHMYTPQSAHAHTHARAHIRRNKRVSRFNTCTASPGPLTARGFVPQMEFALHTDRGTTGWATTGFVGRGIGVHRRLALHGTALYTRASGCRPPEWVIDSGRNFNRIIIEKRVFGMNVLAERGSTAHATKTAAEQGEIIIIRNYCYQKNASQLSATGTVRSNFCCDTLEVSIGNLVRQGRWHRKDTVTKIDFHVHFI